MTTCQDEDPFEGMKIKDWRGLDKIEGRATCLKCHKSRKYFCYSCYIPVPELQDHVPSLKLPLKIDIIKHANEIDGKSTAAHAAVIAPSDVTIYTYPCIPDYNEEENVVLIFPGKNALTIQEYVDKHSKANKTINEGDEFSEPLIKRANVWPDLPISRAVFIDSTWNQSRGIYKDQRLRDIPCVVIQSRISQFWRHQHGSPRWFLATIEAVHQFLVEFHIICKLGINEQIESKLLCESEEAVNEKPSFSKTPVQEDDNITDKLALCESTSSSTTNENNKDDIDLNLKTEPEVDSSLNNKSSKVLLPDKQPSKFVKNLALNRGIRSDSGDDPGINLCGPDQWKGKYGGDYDNLLFFFQFMYHKIHSIYDHSKLRSYQRDMV